VRKAEKNALYRFSELGIVYERLAKSAMRTIGVDFI
jgi:hypothetical protein